MRPNINRRAEAPTHSRRPPGRARRSGGSLRRLQADSRRLLERITRKKGDGNAHPDRAIDEVLAIAGRQAQRRRRDHLQPRGVRPELFTRLGAIVALAEVQVRVHILGKQTRSDAVDDRCSVSTRCVRRTCSTFAAFQRELGFRADVVTDFYNHHEAHALADAVLQPRLERRLPRHRRCRRRHGPLTAIVTSPTAHSRRCTAATSACLSSLAGRQPRQDVRAGHQGTGLRPRPP